SKKARSFILKYLHNLIFVGRTGGHEQIHPRGERLGCPGRRRAAAARRRRRPRKSRGRLAPPARGRESAAEHMEPIRRLERARMTFERPLREPIAQALPPDRLLRRL